MASHIRLRCVIQVLIVIEPCLQYEQLAFEQGTANLREAEYLVLEAEERMALLAAPACIREAMIAADLAPSEHESTQVSTSTVHV